VWIVVGAVTLALLVGILAGFVRALGALGGSLQRLAKELRPELADLQEQAERARERAEAIQSRRREA
jgi:hypothetical protein